MKMVNREGFYSSLVHRHDWCSALRFVHKRCYTQAQLFAGSSKDLHTMFLHFSTLFSRCSLPFLVDSTHSYLSRNYRGIYSSTPVSINVHTYRIESIKVIPEWQTYLQIRRIEKADLLRRTGRGPPVKGAGKRQQRK